MADSSKALQLAYAILIYVSNKAHALFNLHLLTVSNNNACAFLTAMLQRIQSPIGVQRNILAMTENAEDAALLMQLVFTKILLLEKLLHNISP